jgi:CubicO group peptidase (beta-lactamase class C family)
VHFADWVSSHEPSVFRLRVEGRLLVEIATDGAASTRFKLASLRKPIIAALFGSLVDSGSISLDSTLADFEIDDRVLLSENEKSARLEQLLSCTSGVYHPAVGDTPATIAEKPARNSVPPGAAWYYNNWDYNVLGAIAESVAGSLFAAFRERIAEPAGMDFASDACRYYADAAVSRYGVHQFALSADALERFGALLLGRTNHRGKPIISDTWRARCTGPRARTGLGEVAANYGYGCYLDEPQRSVFSWGSGGQVLALFAERELQLLNLMATHEPGSPRLDQERVERLIRAARALLT